ncbi:MAG: preprotein translocase subunit SecE [Clostridia bacterium]|nr:preprotein translocase subunit SecE [Clostridia bacterium]
MAKDAKNKDVKNKKHFFKDFKAELKKVIWPTPKQIVNNTIAVITIVLIAAFIVFVLDFVFNIFNDKVMNQLKLNIRNKTAVEETIEVSTSEN